MKPYGITLGLPAPGVNTPWRADTVTAGTGAGIPQPASVSTGTGGCRPVSGRLVVVVL